MSKSNESSIKISGGRLWLFRIIATVIAPIALLVLLEISLRVAGFGFSPHAFVKDKADGKAVWCSNNKFGWWFFPPRISREFEPFAVPDEKAANAYRIFILGESAAQGDPEPSYGFSRQLMVMLRQEYPSVNFEVYNAAMTAINSHVILKIAEDCARLKPDLFVIYMGNNEVVGPYGAGTVFSPLSKNLFVIRMSIAIKGTRTGQLISRLTEAAGRAKGKPENWGGLEMFLGKQIRKDDDAARMKYVYGHFKSNLEDILQIAQGAGAKAVISTVAVNLKDCAPFASLHRADLNERQEKDFNEIYQSGIGLEKDRDFYEAYQKYLMASKIDETFAEIQFRIGRCLWNLDGFEEARERYIRAKELDTLRFRADSKINQIIAEASKGKTDKGIYFVDAEKAFAKESPHECPGRELFLEHVHPTFSGNYLLGKTVMEQVEGVLPDKIKEQKSKDVNEAGEDLCAERLAFTVFDRLRLMQTNLKNISRAPYINQAYHDEDVNYWTQKAEQIRATIGADSREAALKQYRQAIEENGSDRILRRNYAKLLIEDKKPATVMAAMEQYQNIIRQAPQDNKALVDLANIEAATKNLDLAMKHAMAAVNYMPTDASAYYTVGVIYQMKGNYGPAKRFLSKAIELNPKLVEGYTNLCWILNQQGNADEAEKLFRKGIEQVPDSAQLHFYLSFVLNQKGLSNEAQMERLKAITLDPNLAKQAK